MDFSPFSSLYNALKEVPLVGHTLKAIEILTKILSELRATMTTLKEAEKKADEGGSVAKAILLTIGGVAGAIASVVAAIADPEPFSRFGLTVAAVGLIAVAIAGIIDLIEAIEKSEEKEKLQKEHRELQGHMNKIEGLLDELKGTI